MTPARRVNGPFERLDGYREGRALRVERGGDRVALELEWVEQADRGTPA